MGGREATGIWAPGPEGGGLLFEYLGLREEEQSLREESGSLNPKEVSWGLNTSSESLDLRKER